MAALTNNRRTLRYQAGFILGPYLVAAATVIYKGALVCLNATGYLVPAADSAGLIFLGVSETEVDNSEGANGDLEAQVCTRGIIDVDKANAAIGDLGSHAWISDDQTVTLTTTNEVYAGKIVGVVSSSVVRLCFDGNHFGPYQPPE
jgi:hypothetical protein